MAGPRAAGEGEGQRDAEGLEMASAAVDAPGEKKSTQEQGEATGAALQKNLDNKVPPPLTTYRHCHHHSSSQPQDWRSRITEAQSVLDLKFRSCQTDSSTDELERGVVNLD